jgi:hypothetical protein
MDNKSQAVTLAGEINYLEETMATGGTRNKQKSKSISKKQSETNIQ